MSPAPSSSRKKTKSAAAVPAKREKRHQSGEDPAQGAAEAERSQGDGPGRPLGARIRARLGQSGAGSLLVFARAGLMLGTGAIIYVVAMFAAVTVVPNVFLMVSGGSGIGPSSPLEMQVTYWLTPALFLNGLIFVLVVVVARWLWRAQRRLGEKARRSLLGEEDGR
ncbi:hypothetical protein [Nocardiopsis sp. NPDC058789]|uniref:hypothetical protein n=1 Tax=Nocardiopsis sp. NPDC058789 TaxID=3346634 RepID=UPI00366A5D9A